MRYDTPMNTPSKTAELDRFTALVDRVISVPKEEITRREQEYRRQVDANPNRRGPKRGAKRKTR